MPVTSDITIDSMPFQPSSIDASTEKINQTLEEATRTAPKWYEMGAAKYREMVYEGRTQFPVPPLLANAKDAEVPSREPGRNVPVRFYEPDNGCPSRGIYLYFHGGGFVMGSEKE